MISDILSETNEKLIVSTHHYAGNEFDYDPEIFDEINDIVKRIEQLRIKLDSPSFNGGAEGAWRFNPDYKV